MRSVLKDLRQPFVFVNCDAMHVVKVWEESHEISQRLLPSMYIKEKEGLWRMDVNVELCEAYESDIDDCDGSDNESSSDDN